MRFCEEKESSKRGGQVVKPHEMVRRTHLPLESCPPPPTNPQPHPRYTTDLFNFSSR